MLIGVPIASAHVSIFSWKGLVPAGHAIGSLLLLTAGVSVRVFSNGHRMIQTIAGGLLILSPATLILRVIQERSLPLDERTE